MYLISENEKLYLVAENEMLYLVAENEILYLVVENEMLYLVVEKKICMVLRHCLYCTGSVFKKKTVGKFFSCSAIKIVCFFSIDFQINATS